MEINFITGVGILALIDALKENETLMELKVDNQVSGLQQQLWKAAAHTPCRAWGLRRQAKELSQGALGKAKA